MQLTSIIAVFILGDEIMDILKLFFEFLKIGAFSFGGGMSTLPYIYEMVEKTSWVDKSVITNILTVSQITPGPFACNIGTIVGNKVMGIPGSIICNMAYVLPEIIFAGVMFRVFEKMQKSEKANKIIKLVRASTLALVLTSSLSIFKEAFINEIEINSIKNIFFLINYKTIFIGIIIFFLQKKKKINTIFLITISFIFAGLIGA